MHVPRGRYRPIGPPWWSNGAPPAKVFVLFIKSEDVNKCTFSDCLSVCSTQQECSPASGPTTAPPTGQQQRTAIHKPFTQSRLPPDLPLHPAPRHITKQELQVLESCLHRWRSEVENDIHGKSALQAFFGGRRLILNSSLFTDLQGSISRIHRTIELMYSDKSIMQVSEGRGGE